MTVRVQLYYPLECGSESYTELPEAMPNTLLVSKDRANDPLLPFAGESPAAWQQTRPLLAVEHIRRMRGGAQSHLMRCSDGGYYVVKFQNNPQGTRVLANEFLGTQLAARLVLPTTRVAILYVSEDLIRLTPDLRVETPRTRIPCQPGLQFGSRYPRGPHRLTVYDFLPDQQLMKVENLHDFAGILVFDKWSCNTDGRQTIFYLVEDGGPYTTVMIDQGFCFNCGEWNFPDAPLRGLYCRHAVYERVRGMDDFEPWLTTLEREFNADVLMDIAKSIPPEWYEFDSVSLHRLLERLDLRRGRIRELLWSTCKSSKQHFPNWKRSVSFGGAAFA